MPETRVTCPHCKKTLRLASPPPALARIRCLGCQEIFSPRDVEEAAPIQETPSRKPAAPVRTSRDAENEVPASRPRKLASEDDEEAVRPARRRSRDDEPRGSRKVVLLALIALLLLAGVGVGVWALAKGGSDKPAEPIAQNNDNNPPNNNLPNNNPPDKNPPGNDNPKQEVPKEQSVQKDHLITKDADREKPVEKPLDRPTVKPPSGEGLDRAVLDRVKKATVYIRVKESTGREATGSGFFSAARDLVLTNAHVIGMLEDDALPPSSIQVILNSGLTTEKVLKASIVTVDRDSDLAVLRVPLGTPGAPEPDPLTIVPARELIETDRVFVIGYPFGEQLGKNVTVSTSSVSSLRLNKKGDLEKVQVNGGMNPGNSGGPVVDARGNVIGVAVSVIRNTQINFAIPGEHVLVVLRGRVSETEVGDSTLTDGKVVVKSAIQFLDPLRGIKRVAVDWWFGDPGSNRPPAEGKQPALQATDGPRTTTTAKYDPLTSKAKVDLPLGTMPPQGKMLWCQERYVDGGGVERWVAAIPHRVAYPIVAEPAVLRHNPTPSRTVLELQSFAQFQLKGKGMTRKLTRNIDANFFEDIRQVGSQGNSTLYYMVGSKLSFGASLDDKPLPRSIRLQQIINDSMKLGLMVRADEYGATKEKLTDMRTVPHSSRAPLETISAQIHESLDMCRVPLKSPQVNPGTTWTERKLVPVDIADEGVKAEMRVTYTYRGTRQLPDAKYAVIHLDGELRSLRGAASLSGKVRGEAVYDLATNRVTVVNVTTEMTMRTYIEGEEVLAKGRLTTDLRRVRDLPLPTNLPSLDLSPSGPVVVTNPRMNPTPPIKREHGKEVRKYEGHDRTAVVMAFSPCGRYFASVGSTNACLVWELATGKLVRRLTFGRDFYAYALMFSKDGEHLLISGMANGHDAAVFNVSNGLEVCHFNKQYGCIKAGWFAPDGSIAASACDDGTVRVWDAKTAAEKNVVRTELGSLNGLALSGDLKYVATSGRSTAIFEMETGKKLHDITPPTGILITMPDGKHFLAGGPDGGLRVYEYTTGNLIRSFSPTHRGYHQHVSMSADGKRVVATSSDGETRLWDAEKGQVIASIGKGNEFGAVKLSPDGKFIGTAHHSRGTMNTLFELSR